MSHFIDQAMERAYHLRQAKRTQQALGELFHILALEPNHLEATMLIIHCYDDLDQYTNALPHAEKLVQLAPDLPHAHYLLGYVHYRLDNNHIAVRHYLEALRLDPEDANYYGSLSFVCMEQGDFAKALQYAEQGLQIDPENANCLNCRTRSLSRLGQHEASQDNLKETLATHPNSEYTHLNAGVTLLEQGDFKGAEKHFTETLRIQPNLTVAQEQLLLTLKCQNPLYRLYFKYFRANETHNNGWRFLLVLYGVYLCLRWFGNKGHWAAILFTFFIIPLVLFIALAEPLSNWSMSRHPKGKHLLQEHQLLGSYAVIIGMGLTILNFLITWLTNNEFYAYLGFFCLSWSILANNFYKSPLDLHTNTYRQIAVGVGMVGTFALVLAWIGDEAAVLLGTIYVVLVILFPWIGNMWLKKQVA